MNPYVITALGFLGLLTIVVICAFLSRANERYRMEDIRKRQEEEDKR
jgi:hypothetical protein